METDTGNVHSIFGCPVYDIRLLHCQTYVEKQQEHRKDMLSIRNESIFALSPHQGCHPYFCKYSVLGIHHLGRNIKWSNSKITDSIDIVQVSKHFVSFATRILLVVGLAVEVTVSASIIFLLRFIDSDIQKFIVSKIMFITLIHSRN